MSAPVRPLAGGAGKGGAALGCTLLIRESMATLTETETRLANYLLANKGEVIRMNTKEFAAACASSPAAVIRFSHKLGFSGFTDLKLDLAQESGAVASDDFQTVIHDNDDMSTLVQKAERIHLRNLSRTYRMINLSVLSAAVAAICDARHIHLFGVGASGLLAMDFLYKSSRIGIPAFYHEDTHTNLATAALLGPEDIVIAISYSGETQETLLAARTAKESGCKIVAITQANQNSLARLADYPLYIPSEEQEFRVGAMTSRTSGHLLLDLLYLGVAKHSPERTEENLHKTRELIRTLQSK